MNKCLQYRTAILRDIDSHMPVVSRKHNNFTVWKQGLEKHCLQKLSELSSSNKKKKRRKIAPQPHTGMHRGLKYFESQGLYLQWNIKSNWGIRRASPGTIASQDHVVLFSASSLADLPSSLKGDLEVSTLEVSSPRTLQKTLCWANTCIWSIKMLDKLWLENQNSPSMVNVSCT